MTPVLFLDFDGPMFPENLIPHSRPISEYPGKLKLHDWITYWEMSVTSVRQLNALYEIYPFDTVVSSSWKHYVERVQVEELFEANGLHIHLHDQWRTPDRFSSYRVNEISWWLDAYTREVAGEYICPAHIILDDPWSGSYLDQFETHGVTRPYLVDPNVGIDVDIYKFMKSDVNSWAFDSSSRVFKRNCLNRDWSGIVD